jgi:hypothetical protein
LASSFGALLLDLLVDLAGAAAQRPRPFLLSESSAEEENRDSNESGRTFFMYSSCARVHLTG